MGLDGFLEYFSCPALATCAAQDNSSLAAFISERDVQYVINIHHGHSGSNILCKVPNICLQRFTGSPPSPGFRSAFRSIRASLFLLTEFLSSCQSSFFTRSPSAQSRSPLSPVVCMCACVCVRAREPVSIVFTEHPRIQGSRKKS